MDIKIIGAEASTFNDSIVELQMSNGVTLSWAQGERPQLIATMASGESNATTFTIAQDIEILKAFLILYRRLDTSSLDLSQLNPHISNWVLNLSEEDNQILSEIVNPFLEPQTLKIFIANHEREDHTYINRATTIDEFLLKMTVDQEDDYHNMPPPEVEEYIEYILEEYTIVAINPEHPEKYHIWVPGMDVQIIHFDSYTTTTKNTKSWKTKDTSD